MPPTPPELDLTLGQMLWAVRYGFVDLIELGLAVTALDLSFKPKDIAAVLVGQR